jgi:MYXO-CTERM domain-containing protein
MSIRNWMAFVTAMVLATLTTVSPAWAVTAPYAEDFESEPTCATQCASTCVLSTSGWTNDTADGRDWLVDTGGTTSGSTGPSVDHDPGDNTGNYLYIETSSPCSAATDISNLISPPLELAGTVLPAASFWFHQFGDDIGELHVDVLDNAQNVIQLDVIPAIVGGNADVWLNTGVIDLTPYVAMNTVHLRIRALHSGNGFEGDQAVDDFFFFDNNTPNLAVSNVGPSACGLGNAETVTVDVDNNGGLVANNVMISYTANGGTPVTETIATIAAGASIQFSFAATADLSAIGPYDISVTAVAAGELDPGDDTDTINGFNGIPFAAGPFVDDFEGANVALQWTAGGTNSDWALGTPAKSVITGAASGANAWVTDLTANYNTSENSDVRMACPADFGALMDPVVRLNVWWQSEFSWDGAVLQYTLDNGASWVRIGDVGTGANWYTDGTINGSPGGQQSGWSGRDGSGSGGWVQATHGVAELGGQMGVRFRVAFGSDTSVVDDGFAFDDFEILSNATLPAITTVDAAPAVPAPDLGGVHQFAMVATQALDITSSGTVGLDTITITNNGDIPDAEITWHIFQDDGDGVFSPATDTQLAMQAQAAGQATVSVMAPVPYATSTRFHVVAELDAMATVGATFDSQITSAADIVFSGAPTLTDNLTYPVLSGTAEVVERITMLPYVDDMSMQSLQIAGRTVSGNQFPTATATGPISIGNPTTNDALVTFEASNGALVPVVGTGLLTFGYPNGTATVAIQHAFDLSAFTVATDILWFELRHADRGSDNSNFDHVFISVDGGNIWDASLLKFNYGAQTDDTWVVDTVDVTAALAAAGLDYSDQVVIRTQANENLTTEFAFVDSVKLGVAPRTSVERNMAFFADGDTDALGTIVVQAQMFTYTISNVGDYDLDISGGFTVLNDVNVANVVITPPASTVLAAGASDTFTAAFDPLMGVFGFDVEIAALDPHLGDDTFTLSISGTAEDPFVDLDVQRPAGTSIADGSDDPQGTIAPAAMQTLTYTVENLGNVDANITGVTIGGETNATASVAAAPASTLAPAETTTFDISYQADANGAFSFDLVVASDDPDEAMYTITVSGDADDGMTGTGGGGAGGGATTSTGGGGTGGAGGSGGDNSGDADDDGGCGCRTAGGNDGDSTAGLALLGLALMIGRRRRRRNG